jgi:alpha-L-glutamate ligase-like protein
MFGLTTPAKLGRAGIAGMNMRNVAYIARNNPRHLYPRVDDKLLTKQIAERAGIAVPPLIGVVKFTGQIKELPGFLTPHEQFVIKPSKGSGGKGILVVVGREGDRLVKPSGSLIGFEDVARHINNTLSGLFSLGGKPDVAMIEAMVQFSRVFDNYTFEGVPDIRVIVYKGYPVMAMTRLSTRASDGKANLHQGAVGVGLDIGTGRALRAVLHDRPVESHPDTGARLGDIEVPHWEELLRLASSCYEVSELGYLGTDVVLDREKGPLILELNARPGLAIQIANGIGIKPRIEQVEQQTGRNMRPLSSDERAAWSMQNFGIL